MFNPEIFAVNVGRTLALLQATPPSKDQQKACLRAVFALTSLASATVRLYDGVLAVDESVLPSDLPFAGILARQMSGHGIAEIAIARGTSATELLLMLKALAVTPGAYPPGDGVAQRLASAGSTGIAVLAPRPESEEGAPRGPSATQAFAIAEFAAAAAESPGLVTTGGGDGAARDAGEDPGSEDAAAADLAAPHGIPADTLVGSALGVVLRSPYGEGILDRLSDLAHEIANTVHEGRLELAVQAIAAVIGLEPAASDDSSRASYGIVLRRMLTKDALRRIAHLLADPRFTPVSTAVLQRAGADGAEVLVDLLSASESPRERRAFLGALRVIPHGTEAVIRMLGHYQWFVVRNVAELLGEMRVEEAVPALSMLLTHRELRVQRAAAVALARIGTAATAEPLRRAMKEGAAELRGVVAASIGGAHARALAMPLVALADVEENADVRAEYLRALGRIGSPEAVEALVRAAEPGGRVFGRRSALLRLAAVEGLRCAGGAAAHRALESLAADGERAVRDAASRALAAETAAAAPGPDD
jgi:hypothetical protein